MASQQLNTMHDLFVMGLKEAYSAEQQLLEAMPKMIEAVSNSSLKQAFQQHQQTTQQQVSRLEEIFEMLDMNPEAQTCHAVQGLIQDAKMIIQSQGNPQVKDAGLIAAEQKTEHFEIAVYGTLRTWASEMGHEDIAEMLQQTLQEESRTDKMLSDMAESDVNVNAPMM